MTHVSTRSCALALSVLFAMPGWLAAQAKPNSAKSEQAPAWGEAVAGQAISIATDKAAYAPLEPIVLTIRFKNVGQEDVRVRIANPLLEYKMIVLFANGKPFALRDGYVAPAAMRNVPHTLFGRRSLDSLLPADSSWPALKPGREKRLVLEGLNRLFDMSLEGEYTLFVRRTPVFKDGEANTDLAITSNKLILKIDDSLGKPIAARVRPPEEAEQGKP